MQENIYPKYSNKWLIDRFFRLGSIDEAIWENRAQIPFSYMSYYRCLTEAGIVRSPGRQTDLGEAIHFFRLKQFDPNMPLGKIYKGLPPSFKTSINTLHRIYNKIEKSVPGRIATSLVISPESDETKVLLGHESSGNKLYGKTAGSLSIPMTFSHIKDTENEKVLRVLQQEVFTKEAVSGKFSEPDYQSFLLNKISGPYMSYRILDVEVFCYRMFLPVSMCNFSSYKLVDHILEKAENIVTQNTNYRYGVTDIVSGAFNAYESYDVVSPLNLALASLQ